MLERIALLHVTATLILLAVLVLVCALRRVADSVADRRAAGRATPVRAAAGAPAPSPATADAAVLPQRVMVDLREQPRRTLSPAPQS